MSVKEYDRPQKRCPICGTVTIRWTKYIHAYRCDRCGAVFKVPIVV